MNSKSTFVFVFALSLVSPLVFANQPTAAGLSAKKGIPEGKLRKFKSIPELAAAMEKYLADGRIEMWKLTSEIRKDLSVNEAKQVEANDKVKLQKGQLQVQNLLKDPKMDDHFRKRQFKQLLKVKIGMARDEVIALYKTMEDDNLRDPTKITFRFSVRNAYSDIVYVNDQMGGALDLPFSFYFSKDNKLIKLSVEVMGEEPFVMETWSVE